MVNSPIERKPTFDKTIMPLRGEGNQRPKTGMFVNMVIKSDYLMPVSEVSDLIARIKQNFIDVEEETKLQVSEWKRRWNYDV